MAKGADDGFLPCLFQSSGIYLMRRYRLYHARRVRRRPVTSYPTFAIRKSSERRFCLAQWGLEIRESPPKFSYLNCETLSRTPRFIASHEILLLSS